MRRGTLGDNGLVRYLDFVVVVSQMNTYVRTYQVGPFKHVSLIENYTSIKLLWENSMRNVPEVRPLPAHSLTTEALDKRELTQNPNGHPGAHRKPRGSDLLFSSSCKVASVRDEAEPF